MNESRWAVRRNREVGCTVVCTSCLESMVLEEWLAEVHPASEMDEEERGLTRCECCRDSIQEGRRDEHRKI